MRYVIPKVLVDAVGKEAWRDASPDILRRCLGDELDDLELLENTDAMSLLSLDLDAAGYVDDPEFCMTRERQPASEDPRLKFQRALFICASTIPGDDVFVAIEQQDSEDYDPPVLVFDWRKAVPYRWTERGTLSELIHGICMER